MLNSILAYIEFLIEFISYVQLRKLSKQKIIQILEKSTFQPLTIKPLRGNFPREIIFPREIMVIIYVKSKKLKKLISL
jgi:hypothetical protein